MIPGKMTGEATIFSHIFYIADFTEVVLCSPNFAG
jgi:hypothetical protein